MSAKAKKYESGGWLGDHQFHFTSEEKADLTRCGLSEEDLHWLEAQMTYFRLAEADAKERPTPAQVYAALQAGEDPIARLRTWIAELDEISRDHIEDGGREYNMPTRPLSNLDADLRWLQDALEIARRRAKKLISPAGGRPPGGRKEMLAGLVVDRFPNCAEDVLRILLPDDSYTDNLAKILKRVRKKPIQK